MTDFTFLEDFSTRWLEAWNSHETDAVLALLHPEVRWDDRTFWPEVLHGREAARGYVERIWTVMPDVAFTELGRFFAPAGDRGVVLFRQEGSGPPRHAGDRRFATHGCDLFLAFDDGLLRDYLASYEITDMMRQLGLLPERRGQVGGAYLRDLVTSSAA